MQTTSETKNLFAGMHKGASILIEREKDGGFYIIVTGPRGGVLYDGWAPESVRTMSDAKEEAVRGAMLDADRRPRRSGGVEPHR